MKTKLNPGSAWPFLDGKPLLSGGLRKSYEQEQIDKLLAKVEKLERILRNLGINIPKDESERKVGAAYTSDKETT